MYTVIFGISGTKNDLSVIERHPYYRGVRKEGLDCIQIHMYLTCFCFYLKIVSIYLNC